MTTDRVDTGTERVRDVTSRLRDHTWFGTLRDLCEIADLLESLATERDTLRTQLSRAKEAMHTAIVKIDNGSPHHARGVLDAALGEMETHNE